MSRAVDPWSRESTYINRRAELEAVLIFHDYDPATPWSRGPSRTEATTHEIRPSKKQPERWERVKVGTRPEVLWPIRRAVAMRDHMVCRRCHSPEFTHLGVDHIIPWSAGGPDITTNLRLLCQHCNQERSNRIDRDEREVLPATWWCVRYWHPESLRMHAPWVHNGVATEWLNIAHRVDPDRDFVNAFCATCHQISATDVTL